MSGHSFMDLVGSDHAELAATDADGNEVIRFKLDYLSPSRAATSGYGTLGVSGGDGRMIAGDESAIVDFMTSLDRNLNERGYAKYTVDSPATDDKYTPNPDTPNWDYRVVYEVWIDIKAFGDAGFGGATIEYVHASPSKGDTDTITVHRGDCPCQRPGGCDDVCVPGPDNPCIGGGTPPDRHKEPQCDPTQTDCEPE
jgi:hypothetical protein